MLLTDENIETIDFDLKADLVGISAMTSYVNRGGGFVAIDSRSSFGLNSPSIWENAANGKKDE
jgi:hypothetical protein